MMRVVELADVVISADSGFASGENTADGVVQVRMHNVASDGTLDWSTLRRVPTRDRQLTRYSLQPGDVLFNSTNSPELVGKSALFSGRHEPVVFSNHFLRLRLDPGSVDPAFVAWWLNYQWRSHQFERLATRWVNQAAVRKDDLLALRMELPSLPDQLRIGAILNHTDRLRRTRRYALELSDGLLVAIFRNRFGSRLRSWNLRPLGELVVITGGGTPSRATPRYFQGQIPWLTSKDMRGDYIWDTEEHITEEAILHSATKLVPAYSVLLVVKSKVLMHRLPVAIAKVPLCHGQDIKSIQCQAGLHHEFARFVLKHYERHLLNLARGANTEGLTLPMLEELPVPDVDYAEQADFADLVDRQEQLRIVQRESLRQAEQLFNSLLHQAFRTPRQES